MPEIDAYDRLRDATGELNRTWKTIMNVLILSIILKTILAKDELIELVDAACKLKIEGALKAALLGLIMLGGFVYFLLSARRALAKGQHATMICNHFLNDNLENISVNKTKIKWVIDDWRRAKLDALIYFPLAALLGFIIFAGIADVHRISSYLLTQTCQR